jgi:hypothetical protein
VRTVVVKIPCRFSLFDPKGSKFIPSGKLVIKDSSGKPVKGPDGEASYYGDGKSRGSMDGEVVSLKAGTYKFDFTPLSTSKTYDFQVAFLFPQSVAKTLIGGGLYVLHVTRTGTKAATVTGEWNEPQNPDADVIMIAESGNEKEPLVQISQ